MAYEKHTPEATVVVAKQRILNKLCSVYIKRRDSRFIPADELRRELGIPENVFAKALNSFKNAEGQMAVEVLQSDDKTDLRLGESMRDLCTDWSPTKKQDSAPNTAVSVAVPVSRLFSRFS